MKLGKILIAAVLFSFSSYMSANNPPTQSINPPTQNVNPPTHNIYSPFFLV
jgi:hypothetical protein